ncbi:4-aminobutyrate aminotransferase GabT [Pseudoclavibacter endophyticus]|uniref:(S)-3-amino-2-methylpropionate transaminase n=1 Tax=Pseudoclavibacter endophyticus TaxID=1778590 RepID=A0A6H9WEA9_9MICO|nr:4-aminobutyrate--2-oxoglutarate transaminase [Pseudoclavibacter endophyticus]KAB1649229.1 4-aminobutyrate--2-oxoglutarate transaminase [Pseudoclavibacter endophyticus]GGA64336.1 4-aminobutyrate aminotransferase GabT [Pseudoclavibacter endophyticus]
MSQYRLEQRRILDGAIPGPRSQELAARRATALPNGVASSSPFYAADADGGVIRDVDGNQFLDFATGIGVTTVGASHPKVVAAIQEAASHFTHTSINVTPYEGYIALAEKLNAITPGDHAKKTVFFNSGAEAVENAIKISRYVTGRDAIVVFDHAFHGRTNLTMGLTAKNMPYKDGFGPFAPEIYRIQTSYPYRDPEGFTGAQAAERAIAQVEGQVGGKNVAAIIIEPLQGEGGFIVPAEGYLGALADYAKQNGALFVSDEIQAGMSRTGEWFCVDHEGVVPDLVTVAKGVGGGMPISAVVGRAEVLDQVHAGGVGGTYAGNPVACASALATIAVMEDEGLQATARAFGDRFFATFEALRDELGDGIVGDVRGRGAMLAIEFIEAGTGSGAKTPNPAAAKAIASAAIAEGAVFLTAGTFGNVIRLLPPLTMPDELFDEGLGILADLIRKQV